MTDTFEKYDVKYVVLPELTPYLKKFRYEDPKETFKCVVRNLKELTQPGQSYSLIDLGCANGEFLYYVKKEFPTWRLRGIDITPEFIEIARKVVTGAEFEVQDLFDTSGEHDVVTFLGTFSRFWDFEPALLRLLSLCKKGGLIFTDGYFNTFDVEVRSIFCDNSTPQSRGIWRNNYAQHSRTRVREFLQDRVAEMRIEDVVMTVEIPRDPEKPHMTVSTIKDEHGRILIVNGANMIMNDTMLVIRK